MADNGRTENRSDATSKLYCKKCKSKVVNYVKCVVCDSFFHMSCAKKSKYDFVTKTSVKCCDEPENIHYTNDDTDSDFLDAMETISVDDKIDIRIFKYIIKQKDLIIEELNDKIKMLSEQLGNQKTDATKTLVEDKKTINEPCVSLTQTQPVAAITKHPKDLKKSKNTNKISTEDMNSEILEIQTKLQCDKYINLDTSSGLCEEVVETDKKWMTVERNKHSSNRRKNLVVGNFSGQSNVEGIEKCLNLHVHNLKPDTTEDQLQTFLSKSFPGVTCVKLNSKYPEKYSSFKVSISKNFTDSIKNPSCWPKNAYVRYFLHRRSTAKKAT